MGQITQSSYDLLGRRIQFIHPDAGTIETQYDLANNMTQRITADIRKTVPNKGAIAYNYDYNRLQEIQYPKNPQNNVRYHYGNSSGTAARRGRLWLVEDATGGQEFFYGKLGEVEKEIRTLRITQTDIQTYVTQTQYDTWNRIQKMTYPDGEILDYAYNRAGNLYAMQGKKESHTYDYIKQLGYDSFEQRKYLKYGNNTETTYNYDPQMRRLQQMQVNSTGRAIMNNNYSYDVMGNVLGISNTVPVAINSLGGPATHTYQYDELYRLKEAKATYQGEAVEAGYDLKMQYNKMHNIVSKDLSHIVNKVQKGYSLTYDYSNAEHPNAPNIISESTPTPDTEVKNRLYTYDGNGNPTSYQETTPSGGGGLFRKMTWDEENRLMGINDNGRIHLYSYDASGERIIKSSGDSQNVTINGSSAATLVHTDNYIGYVSPYFVISKGKFTKHYFEGAGRITSKLGQGTFAQPLGITAGGINYGKLSAEEQVALDAYVKTLGVPPGPPSQVDIYSSPTVTGSPYPSVPKPDVNENETPPLGWPRNPIFNAPGDVPGAPVQYGPPLATETLPAGQGFVGNGLPENDIFFFHPDHLGSTSYISTLNGSVSQHVEYIAFGEILFEEHSSSYKSPYLFNGKELDRETNLSYFGARYYDAKVSLWLNVDPLAENYPNVGSYMYCFNNPINLIDPDGKKPIDPIKDALNAVTNVKNVLQGKKWIDYQDVHVCGKAARQQNNQIKNSSPVYDGSQINMVIDKKRQDVQDKLDKSKTAVVNISKGINTLVENLKKGKPVVVGVNYNDSDSPGNDNVATDHYVNVVGMGKDKKGVYFSYYDNYVDPTSSPTPADRENKATDVALNRFYYDDKSMKFVDDTPTTITGPNHAQYGNFNYTITEVKPNQ